MPGCHRQPPHLGDGVVPAQCLHVHPGDHGVCRHLLLEGDRPGQQCELLVVEVATFARRSDHELELLHRSDPGELVSGFDAELPHRPVGRGVEESDHRTVGPIHELHRYAEQHGRRIRPGDRHVLGHQLPEDHLAPGRDGDGHADRDRQAGRLRHPGEALDQRLDSAGDGRLGDGADDEGGSSDPELRTGQLEGEIGEGSEHAPRSPVTRLRQAFHLAAFNRHDRELTRHEETVEQDEHHHHDEAAVPVYRESSFTITVILVRFTRRTGRPHDLRHSASTPLLRAILRSTSRNFRPKREASSQQERTAEDCAGATSGIGCGFRRLPESDDRAGNRDGTRGWCHPRTQTWPAATGVCPRSLGRRID